MRLHVISSFRVVLLSSAMSAGLVLLPTPARAQDDAFKAGIDAGKSKNWQEAAQQMRRAIERDPRDATRKVGARLGLGGTEYLPHFYLGEALFHLGDCAGAVDEWWTSERQGQVQSRLDSMKILQDGYIACEGKGVLPPAKYEPLFAKTTLYVTEVSNQAGAVNKLGTANADLWQSDARQQQYQRAYGEFQTAIARLERAKKSHATSDFNEATAAADRARVILVALDANLNSAIYARLSTQGQARDIEQVLGSADAFDKAIEAKRASLTPELSAARQQGRDAMGRARDRLADGVKASNPAALSESRTIAQDATTRLKHVVDELTRIEHDALLRQLSDATARGNETFSLVAGAVANYERLANGRPDVGPDVVARKVAIQGDAAKAKVRFDTAVKAENLKGVVDATAVASASVGKLNEIISTFGPLSLADRGVHPALIEGARLFLAGEYEQVLGALNPPDGFAAGLPLQLHIHLFRAAASYALFLRSGETNQMLREQTVAEIAQCKQIDSAFEPDRRVFTPRFIGVFHDGALPSGGAAKAAGSQ